jgi:vitamin B12 transporter
MKSRLAGSIAPVNSRVAAFSSLFAAAWPLLAASSASAQVASASPPDQQVVITAARAAQKLPDALPSTTVISRADIQAAPALDLPELLRSFTSFNIAQTGPLGSQTSVFVRGANSNQVLVLVDGAPLSRADFGSAPWELVPLAQIDHVEIVRGNLSSLYGAQAVGGVVQVFTRRGAGASVEFAAGSHGTILGSGSLGQRLGDAATPLDISASVSSTHTAGFSARDPKTDPTANPDRDPSTQSGATFAIAKTWTPGQLTRFSVMHSDTDSRYDGYSATFKDDVVKSKLDSFSLRSHHAVNDALSVDLDAGESVEHDADPTGFTPEGQSHTRLAGIGADWTLVDGHSLQFGYENQAERYSDTSTSETKRRTNSLRAGYLGHFGTALEVQANVRRDKADDYGSATTGLLALGWRISPEWKLVAQGSTAFSAPSFSNIQYEIPGHPLKAEHSRDLELGLHWQHAGWLARVTWFSQRQHDLIAFTPTFQTTNIDHASNRGAELSVDGDTGFGKLGLEATFQRPRDDDSNVALARRARTVAAVNYRVPVLGWETGVWLHYTGARPDLDPASFATVQAKARTSLGLSAQHALSPNWTVGLKADNLTGTHTPEVLGYTPPPRSLLATLRGQWQ